MHLLLLSQKCWTRDETGSSEGIEMISADLVVPNATQIAGNPCLTHFASGVPRILSWQKGRFGPTQTFNFVRLSSDEWVMENAIECVNGHEFIPIGTFQYTNADVTKEDHVCVDACAGSLWRFVSPEVIMFLNSSPAHFCRAFRIFDDLLSTLREKSAEGKKSAWEAFDRQLHELDPQVFEHEISYWADITGEAILRY